MWSRAGPVPGTLIGELWLGVILRRFPPLLASADWRSLGHGARGCVGPTRRTPTIVATRRGPQGLATTWSARGCATRQSGDWSRAAAPAARERRPSRRRASRSRAAALSSSGSMRWKMPRRERMGRCAAVGRRRRDGRRSLGCELATRSSDSHRSPSGDAQFCLGKRNSPRASRPGSDGALPSTAAGVPLRARIHSEGDSHNSRNSRGRSRRRVLPWNRRRCALHGR